MKLTFLKVLTIPKTLTNNFQKWFKKEVCSVLLKVPNCSLGKDNHLSAPRTLIPNRDCFVKSPSRKLMCEALMGNPNSSPWVERNSKEPVCSSLLQSLAFFLSGAVCFPETMMYLSCKIIISLIELCVGCWGFVSHTETVNEVSCHFSKLWIIHKLMHCE